MARAKKKNRKINEDAERKDGAKETHGSPHWFSLPRCFAVFRGEGEGGQSDAVFRAKNWAVRICVRVSPPKRHRVRFSGEEASCARSAHSSWENFALLGGGGTCPFSIFEMEKHTLFIFLSSEGNRAMKPVSPPEPLRKSSRFSFFPDFCVLLIARCSRHIWL